MKANFIQIDCDNVWWMELAQCRALNLAFPKFKIPLPERSLFSNQRASFCN